ncbi:MAG TPA: phosphodiester glycosidase family protein [Sphingomicrobium sp.]|nr:phosphodiester glycosidase family protein [Sphingomicrobium sp.]
MLLALLFLAACAGSGRQAEPVQSFCSEQTFEGSRFTVCDNQGGAYQLFAARKDETPIRSFADLSRRIDAKNVAFAMNAGMFDEEGRPIGLTRIGGKEAKALNVRDGRGNFHLKPNGVFMILCGGRTAAIYRSDAIPEFRCAPRLATQSGPMLVIDGKLHPAFEADGTSRHVRNGVGVTADGTALFVISEEPVSLGKFARFFRDRLRAPNALYFDGAVSSLWDPANGRQDSHSQLGPIIVAFKPAGSAPGP